MKKVRHLIPYKVSWLHKGNQIMVSTQCEVDFQIGAYKDKILCDVMPMDIFHILLGRPWQFYKRTVHDCRRNCHRFEENGIRNVLMPLKEGSTVGNKTPKILLLSVKEYLQ